MWLPRQNIFCALACSSIKQDMLQASPHLLTLPCAAMPPGEDPATAQLHNHIRVVVQKSSVDVCVCTSMRIHLETILANTVVCVSPPHKSVWCPQRRQTGIAENHKQGRFCKICMMHWIGLPADHLIRLIIHLIIFDHTAAIHSYAASDPV